MHGPRCISRGRSRRARASCRAGEDVRSSRNRPKPKYPLQRSGQRTRANLGLSVSHVEPPPEILVRAPPRPSDNQGTMTPQRLSIAVLTVFLFTFPRASRAQNTGQQPAPAPASAPAAATPPADSKPPAKAPAAKKVWTNEDMGSLTGPTYDAKPNRASKQNSYHPQSTSGSPNGSYYRNQINSLKSKIDDIDRKLDNYEALAHGEAPSQGEKQTGVRISDSRADVQDLLAQKQKLQAQISDLEDQARHAGVEPGQLR